MEVADFPYKTKTIHQSLFTPNLNGTFGVYKIMAAIAQGTADDQRIGNRILVKKIEFVISGQYNGQIGLSYPGQTLYVDVWQANKIANGLTPNIQDMYEPDRNGFGTAISFLLDTKEAWYTRLRRINIKVEDMIRVDAQYAWRSIPAKFFSIDLDQVVNYSGSSGVLSETVDKSWFLAIASNPQPLPAAEFTNVALSAKVTYIDM